MRMLQQLESHPDSDVTGQLVFAAVRHLLYLICYAGHSAMKARVVICCLWIQEVFCDQLVQQTAQSPDVTGGTAA